MHLQLDCACGCRDMSVETAIELGRRSIYHATFRDAVSGGTVSGMSMSLLVCADPVLHNTPDSDVCLSAHFHIGFFI